MKRLFTAVLFVIIIGGVFFSHASASVKRQMSFVIIFPGGPSAAGEGDRIAGQFVEALSGETGIARSLMKGKFYNSAAGALKYLKKHPDSFIMGSAGFYLQNRRSLKLAPLASIIYGSNNMEQYYVMVKKGSYNSFEALKGKTIAGNAFLEGNRFVDKIIFNSSIDTDSYFRRPKRILSTFRAIKRVVRGRLDAVILDSREYRTLLESKMGSKLQKVFTSVKYPSLSLMMIDTPVTRSYSTGIVNAVTGLCRLEKGREVCKSFGIDGFKKISEKELLDAIRKYESAD